MSAKPPEIDEEIAYYHAAQLFGDSQTVRVADGSEESWDIDGETMSNHFIQELSEEGQISQPELTVWYDADADWLLDEDISDNSAIKYRIEFEVEWYGAEESTGYGVRGFPSEDDYEINLCPSLEKRER
jgi:hypothetical protein